MPLDDTGVNLAQVDDRKSYDGEGDRGLADCARRIVDLDVYSSGLYSAAQVLSGTPPNRIVSCIIHSNGNELGP